MGLNFSQGGYEALFCQTIQSGINLFCGAGFSVEASDASGRKLPTGNLLLDELKINFPIISSFNDLAKACTVLEAKSKASFLNFITNRFQVASFDARYTVLNEFNITGIYTTNIDDLFFKIYETSNTDFSSKHHYLIDRGQKGAVYQKHKSDNVTIYNDDHAVPYAALHGCVRNNSSEYIFSTTKIARAYTTNGNTASWDALAKDVAKRLFGHNCG